MAHEENEAHLMEDVQTGAALLAEQPTLFRSPEDLPVRTTSSLVFVRPDKTNSRTRRLFHPYIPTRYLMELFAKALQAGDTAQHHSFFRVMSSHPLSRSTAGWLFEGWIHSRFRQPKRIDITWKDNTSTSITSVVPIQSGVAGVNELKKMQPGSPFYWQPAASNYPSIDGIYYDGDTMYLLQATIAVTHSLTDTGFLKVHADVCAGLKSSATPWRLVFVGDNEATVNTILASADIRSLPQRWHNVAIGACTIGLPLLDDDWVRFYCSIKIRQLAHPSCAEYDRASTIFYG